MSEIGIITDGCRRRLWSAADKLRIVKVTMFEGGSNSAVARRNGVAPNLLYRWRNLMLEGGSITGAYGQSMIGFDFLTTTELDALAELIRYVAGVAQFGAPIAHPPRPKHADLRKGEPFSLPQWCIGHRSAVPQHKRSPKHWPVCGSFATGHVSRSDAGEGA